MIQNMRGSAIDFAHYITERTEHFIGREWVFQAVHDWLRNPDGSRYFLLLGEPGSGKTAIASRLAQISQGTVPSPAGFSHLSSDFLSAVHFCSARDSRWINPSIFAESLALQLAERYPGYAESLAEVSGDRQIHIEVQQCVEQGQAIGVVINQLHINGVLPEDAFNSVVREPLEALFRGDFDQQIVMLVDGLDEALDYSGRTNILSFLSHLHELPSAVRFLLTSRQDVRIANAFLDADELALSSNFYEQRNREDIRRYVTERLGNDEKLVVKVAELDAADVSKRVVETVVRKAEGNFLYTRFLLDAIAEDKRPLTELEGLPEGLDGLYFESLQRVVRLGRDDWQNDYAPLIGMLSVAQESPTLAQIRSFTEQSATKVLKWLDDLGQFIEEVKASSGGDEIRYRLYHQSVIDFLHSQLLSIRKKEKRNTFYLSAEECHKAFADWCGRGDLAAIWEDTMLNQEEQGRRMYARAYYVTHLYGAYERQRLFTVLDEGAYGQAKVQQYDTSTLSFAQDLDLGRQAACYPGKDGRTYLPQLWKYTLLRCSLNSVADQYMPEVFEALLLLKREKEARGIAELLTKPGNKAKVLLQIANCLETQPDREQEYLQLLNRIYEVLQSAEEGEEKASVSQGLCAAFLRKGQWAQAEAVIDMVENSEKKTWMAQRLAIALAETWEWDRAEMIAYAIAERSARAEVLWVIGALLAEVQDLQRAEAIWFEAEALVRQIQDDEERAWALEGFCAVLTQAQQWKRARAMAQTIEVKRRKIWALQNLCEALARAGEWEQAESLTPEIEFIKERVKTLFVLGIELARRKYQERAEIKWSEAETLMRTIEDSRAKVWAFLELGTILAQEGYQERAEAMWSKAEAVARTMEDDRNVGRVLLEVGKTLVQAGQLDRAAAILTEAEVVISNAERSGICGLILHELTILLVQARQWEHAETIARTIGENNERVWVLQELCEALARAGQWERAEAVACLIKDDRQKAQALLVLCAELAQAQQWKQADVVWNKVPTLNYFLREEREARVSVLLELGLALAKAQQSPQAEAVLVEAEALIDTIEEDTSRASALYEFSATLARAGLWERAEVVVRRIQHDTFRAWALEGYCMILAQTEQWERAIAFARLIEESSVKANALQALGIALMQAQLREQAETALVEANEVVHAIGSNSTARAWALYRLGCAFLQIGEKGRAEGALVEAEKVALTIEDGQAKAGVLQMISVVLAKAQMYEQAKVVASAIEDRNTRANTLQQLGVAFAQAQHWEDAEAVVQMIEDSKAKTWVLQELGTALAQAGYLERAEAKWAEAEVAAQTINDYEGRAFAMQKLGVAFAQTGQLERAEAKWAEAEASVSMITDSKARDWTLQGLCLLLVQAQQWRRAKAVVDMIERDDDKARALTGLATALSESEQWNQAEEMLVEVETLVHTLRDYQSKIGLLHNIANIFEKADKSEEMIHLTQRALLQASTKIYAIRLLSLITRLIPRNSAMGTTFSQAFTWVDSFSKG